MKRRAVYRGGSISYNDAGRQDGYAILVQHGLIASIEDGGLFDRLVRLGTRVISIARPGYGESAPCVMRSLAEWADIIAVVVDDLGLSRFDVLGISSGAPYAYSIGAGLSDRVRDIFILSGVPALYDPDVLRAWPYEPLTDTSLPYLQQLAHRLFFSALSKDELEKGDVRDSMANDCFGVAQDLGLRFMDWGFSLSDLKADVHMQHSRTDDSVPYETALRTSLLIPDCVFETVENGPHFSAEALDRFILRTMAPHYG